MRTNALLVALLLFAAPAWGVETWYFVTAAGPNCTTGGTADDGLSQTAGSSNASHALDVATQDLHYDEDRTIASGTWQVWVDVNCGSGGGPGPEVDIDVSRRAQSDCSVVTTLISCTGQSVTKGATVEVTCSGTPGSVAFADTDLLVARVVQSRGSVSCSSQFNNSTSSHDSRIDHPDEAAAGDELMVISP